MDEVSAAFGLFGREGALRAVNDVLVSGGNVVVTGDPGAGKSSLLRASAQLAKARGRRVLSVTPTQFDRGLPFAGLAELVAQFPEGAESGLPGPQRRALAVALQRADPGEREVDALAVPLAVRGLLTQLTGSGPVAIVIDDLQWLDHASVGSLGFALRRLPVAPQRLSVLVGTRPDPGAGADLIRCLTGPGREFRLPPLEDWAIGQLLRKRLGPRWTPPMSAGVARASGGNPFLALEIARAMQAGAPSWPGSTQPGHDPVFPVPPSLAELLGERVTRLPQDAREILLLVAAAGRLTMAQLQGIVEPGRLWPALEAAVDADMVLVSAESVVAFTHPLLASASYDAAAPAERRRAHRVLADGLDDLVERARHRARSITAPDEEVAGELERAAGISRGRGAPQLAGELMEAAALATPAAAGGGARFGRWLRVAESYTRALDDVAARAALDQASALAENPGQRAQVLMRRVRLAPDHYCVNRPLAEQAFRLAPAGSEVRAEALHTLSIVHRVQGRGRLAWRLANWAVTESAAVGRTDVQVAALNERVAIERLWGLGQPQRSMRDIERQTGRARRGAPPAPADEGVDGVGRAYAKSFFAAWNDQAAEAHVRDGIRSAIDAGRYVDLSPMYISLILVLIRASRVRDAQAALGEAERSGAWSTVHGLQEDMARILVAEYSGDLDLARGLAHRALARPGIGDLPYWQGGFLAQLGFIETSARDWPAALEPLRQLAGIFASTRMVDLEQLLWPVDYADAALQAGAGHDVEAAISLLRNQGSAGRPEAAIAADRCQALLAAARGEADGAMAGLRAIADRPGSECPFEAARSRLALGQVCRRAGYKGMASETLNAAAAAFEELGIPRWAERARDDAGRVGLRPATGTLTETERRVAGLVASGRSNQETAAELFMSVKTVEANLTRVYRKLSVRSRTELANHLNHPGAT